MHVVVVGSGIAGLASAYLLSEHHRVTLLEAEGTLGGHAHTLTVKRETGEWEVDTGFLVYTEATYPRLTRLFAELEVPTQPSTMSFSFEDPSTGLLWQGSSLNGLLARRANLVDPVFWRMMRGVLALNASLRRLLAEGLDPTWTLADLIEHERISPATVEAYLVPMGSAIWSADPRRFLETPARAFAEFFSRHGLLSVTGQPDWRTVTGGSRVYVEALAARLVARGARIHLDRPARRVRREAHGVVVDLDDGRLEADHVVLACHSDQARSLLVDPTDRESAALEAVRFQANAVTLHTDTSLLPRHRRAWAAWNYRAREGVSAATLTYDVTRLQSIPAPERFLVTLNSDDLIDDATVIERFTYAHPVLDGAARRAAGVLAEGGPRTSYAGAWLGDGFHEDGLASAVEVAAAFGKGR